MAKSPWLSAAELISEPDDPRPKITKAEYEARMVSWLRDEPTQAGRYMTRSNLAAGPECFGDLDYYTERKKWLRNKPDDWNSP